MNQTISRDHTSFTQQKYLTDYFNIIKRRRWIIITFFLFVVLVVAVKTFMSTPHYKATSQIIIERRPSHIVDMRERIPREVIEEDYYQTQYDLLKSRALAYKVIEDLKLREYLSSIKIEKPKNVQEPNNLTTAKKVIENSKVLLSPSDSNNKETLSIPLIAHGENELPLITQSENEFILKEYVLKDRDTVVDWYLKKLEITPVPKTRLVNISFTGKSPEITVLVANAHANAFINRSIELQASASQDTLEWIEKRLHDQKAKVEASQRAIHEYTKAENMISLEDRQNIISQKLMDLNNIFTKAKADRIAKQTAYHQLKSLSIDNESLFSLPEIAQDSIIQEMRSNLAQFKGQRLEMSAKFGPKHPKMIEFNSRIRKLEQEINEEVQRIGKSIKAALDRAIALEKSIQKTLEEQKLVAMSLNEKTVDYEVLRQEAESNQETYDFLLKQAKEAGLKSAMKSSNIQIVDMAELPRLPYKPKIFLNLLLSVVLGLVFGTGLAFFFDYIDNTIKSPEDIIQRLGMPVIGMLPYDKSVRRSETPALPFNDLHNERNKLIGEYSQYYNASGSLVSGLPVGRSGTSGQILMVESTTAGEGKTTILAKSAINLARGGQRVLMVDADLPRSYLHRLFGVENNGKGGLVNAMTGILSQKIDNGDLRKCSVHDLFSLIALRKQSGRLIITNDNQSITAFFENGRLFHIQSKESPFENRLGSTLLRGGFITESQLKDALERNQRTGQPIGYILINAGYITQDKLQGPLKLQVEEILQRLFSWKQGTFTFEECITDIHEDKRIFFQEDYVPIIDRLGRTAQSKLIESELLSYVRSLDEPNLSILTAGTGHAKAEGPLYYGLLAKFLDILKQRFDVVLIDAPPVLPALSYVMPLVSIADGVIFVVKAGGVSVRDINKAKTHIEDAKANIIGTILNQIKLEPGYYN